MRNLIPAAALLVAMASCGPADAAANKYGVTPEEAAACQPDAVRLCEGATDEDDIVACFRARREQLTPVCRRTFEHGLRKRRMAP